MASSLDDFAEEASRGLLRQQNARLRSQVKGLEGELFDLHARLDLLERIDRLNPEPPRWANPKKPGPRQAVVVAMLSDCHLDEIVRPEDIGGINAYNRKIATRRLRAWAEGVVIAAEDGPNLDLRGCVLLLGGDMLTGPIDVAHLQDADDTLFGSLLYWSEQLAAAITLLADELGKVHVPVVVGNHGRLELQKRTHLAAKSNSDWHLGHLVARLCAGDDRVTFQIDESPDAEFDVMGQRHLLTHGDQVRGGGSGIGGIWPPIMRLTARKQQRAAQMGRPFQHLWMGHFHQATFGPQFTVNGSLKGYDAFASVNNFPAEAAQQVVAFVDRERIAWRTTIVVD